MEPALPLPLRLQLAHNPVPMDHTDVSDSISSFLTSYAARTGTHNAASNSEDSATASGSTGGVVAAQLTRLMNGLQGRIDYGAFADLISGLNSNSSSSSSSTNAPAVVAGVGGGAHTTFVDDDEDVAMDNEEQGGQEADLATPVEILENIGDGEGKESFSKADELINAETPNVDSSLREDSMQVSPSKEKSKKKDKKDKKEKKDKKDKKVKMEA